MGKEEGAAEELNRELSELRRVIRELELHKEAVQDELVAKEKHLLNYHSTLGKFNEFTKRLANLPYQDIFPFVAASINDVFGVSAVWLSTFDVEKMESVIEFSSLTGKEQSQIEMLLGQKIVGFKMPWTQTQYEQLLSEDYWSFGSLTELTFGIVPPAIGKAIELAIGIDWLNGIPLVYQGKLVGKLIIIGNSKQPIPDKEEVILFSGIVANAIGRKRAEEALDLSEVRFREMVELLPMSVWETDLNGHFTFVNRAGLALFGYDHFDLAEHRVDLTSCIVPSERALASKRVGALLNGAPTHSREYTAIRKDGSQFPVLINAQVIIRDGKSVGFRGVSIDLTESKQKEEALSSLEIQLQGVLDAATEISIIAVNHLGVIRLFNKGAEKMLGYSAEEAYGKQIPEFLHPKEEMLVRESELLVEFNRKVEGFEAFVIRAKEGKAETLECHYVRKDGSLVLVSLVVTSLYDDKGEINGFLGVAIDITAKRNADRIIKESEEKYRTLMENMNEVVMLVDNDDRVLFVNKKFTELLGYSLEEIIGKIGYEVLLENESQEFIVAANNDRKSGVSGQYEIRFKKKGGGFVDFLVSGAPMLDAEGNVVGSIGTMMDISDRKAAEEMLKESQHLFQTLTQSSPVGIFRTDASGYTTYVNPKWCEFSGLEAERALGYGWLDAVHPLDRESLKEGWGIQLVSDNSIETEYRFLKPDGEITWVIGRSVPEKVDGKINGYIGTLTDITSRKEAEMELLEKTEEINVQNEEYLQLNEELIQLNEELYMAKNRAEESDRLKSAFLANMSHEIRTPMNGIIGFSKILTEPDISKEERKEYSNVLNNSCLRLLNTVNDILDVSKLDSGQMEIRYSVFPPIKVLNELFTFYIDRYRSNGVTLELKVDYRLSDISINADERKLYQIMSNLLDNALKFTPEGGTVVFGFDLCEPNIVLYVTDTGIGIAKELKQFVFGRFNQENLTLSRGHEGTGLGLSICKGLTEMMGGEIFVESEVGKGSTFSVKLPFQTATEQIRGADQHAERIKRELDLHKKTVLVAEDDHSSYLLVERILTRDLNANVVRAKDGLEAVALFEKMGSEITVVLMDIKMPLMDGFEATRRIRTMSNAVPIVALTAFAMKQDRDAAIDAGCNDYISKPITPMQLLAKLRTVIGS
jgi:PAS domain S-box-containing protein